MKKLVVSLLFFFCLNVYAGERNVEWEGSDKLYEPEYTPGIFNKIGIGLWKSFSINHNSNFKILQFNLIYGQAKDIYGLNIGLANGVINGNYENQTSRRQEHIGLTIGLINNNSHYYFKKPVKSGEFEELTGFDNIVGNNTIGLSIGGSNRTDNMTGLQIALLNLGLQENNGIQFALLGNGAQKMNGLQIAIGNYAKELNGVQISLFLNGIQRRYLERDTYYSRTTGLQITSFINSTSELHGVQIALFANQVLSLDGIQIGFWNVVAKQSNGIQIGAINYCRKKARLQIGLLNLALENPIPFFPFINFNF